VAYVDSGELFVINPEIQKFIPLAAKKDATDYYVKAGWLLMACSGQLYGIIGDAVLATRWHEEKVLSNHILRIVPKSGMRPGYLLAALTHTDLGRPLVLRAAFGTSIPELDPIELGAMPIVRLGRREDVIADKMERAAQLRGNADDLENDATELFESAISRAFGEIVNHSIEEYARTAEDGERVTTNTAEGFFGNSKRSIDGTHHSISRKHTGLYFAELDHKYNTRKMTDGERTVVAIRRMEGKRLMLHAPQRKAS
jgi:hypothetical protein